MTSFGGSYYYTFCHDPMTLYNKLGNLDFIVIKWGMEYKQLTAAWEEWGRQSASVRYELRGLLLIKQYKGVKWCWNITTGLIVGEYWRFSAGGSVWVKGASVWMSKWYWRLIQLPICPEVISMALHILWLTLASCWSAWRSIFYGWPWPVVGTFQVGQTNWGMKTTRVSNLIY
jgi:hypothetical protein